MTGITIQGFKYDEHNKVHRWIRSGIIIIVSLTIFLIIWWAVAASGVINTVPTPMATWEALVDLVQNGSPGTHKSIWVQLWSSIVTYFKGMAIALVVAIPLGLLLGYVKPLRELITPMIEVLRPIAPIAWAPIFISTSIFGYTWGAALVVFMGMVFPLLTSTIFGVQRIESSWIDASKTLGASSGQIFTKVVFPASVPYILNGLKTALGVGWMCIIAAEMYATPLGGIGYFVSEMAMQFNFPYAFAGLIFIAILGLLTTGVAEQFSKYVSKRMGME